MLLTYSSIKCRFLFFVLNFYYIDVAIPYQFRFPNAEPREFRCMYLYSNIFSRMQYYCILRYGLQSREYVYIMHVIQQTKCFRMWTRLFHQNQSEKSGRNSNIWRNQSEKSQLYWTMRLWNGMCIRADHFLNKKIKVNIVPPRNVNWTSLNSGPAPKRTPLYRTLDVRDKPLKISFCRKTFFNTHTAELFTGS